MGLRRSLAITCAVALALPACVELGEAPPNIVLVIGDDHGYPYAGFMGSRYVPTPNLDRLAAEGTVFTHAYGTASVCRPSLRSLLTGLHPLQLEARVAALAERGVVRGASTVLAEFETLPKRLAEHGYVSFQAGKLWESTFGVVGFTAGTKTRHRPGVGAFADAGTEGLHVGRTTLDPVTDFIDAHTDQPFFLWFAPLLPHAPFDAPQDVRARLATRGLSRSAIDYYANVVWLDDTVGALLAHLETRDLLDNTLVVYVSDNGFDQAPGAQHPNVPLVGGARGKGSLYELGFRTPLVFRWPGHVPAGAVHADLVSTVDLYPTLLDYVRRRSVSDLPKQALPEASLGALGGEGRSLRRRIEEATSAPVRDRLFGSQARVRRGPGGAPGAEGIHDEQALFARDERWHYIWYRDNGTDALFDIVADPAEQQNLASLRPEIVRSQRAEIAAWETRMRRAPDDGQHGGKHGNNNR